VGRIIKYEVVNPHYCPACDAIVGQTSKSAAWIGRAFPGCAACDHEDAALLLKAYQDGLKVTFIERSADV
jgi:hypothetical protein